MKEAKQLEAIGIEWLVAHEGNANRMSKSGVGKLMSQL